MPHDRITADLAFSRAAELWLSSRRLGQASTRIAGYIKPNTDRVYEQYVRSLNLFFANLRLQDVHSGHIRSYQEARILGSEPFIRRRRPHEQPRPCPTKPQKVNQELQVLVRIIKRAGCWSKDLQTGYEPLLSEDSEIPRALSPEQQSHWLLTSQQKERWMLVHWYSVAAFQTTLGTNEMRGLRLGDINLVQRVVTVPPRAAKKRRRARTIPLNTAEVLWAFGKLAERAHDCGCREPQHYLFPFRERGKRTDGEGFNPNRPMTESGLKRVWGEVREASGLRWFRTYDTRHTAITRMAEAGVPATVIEEYAGHVGDRMRRHYTQISETAARSWGMWAFQGQRPPQPPPTYAQPAAPPAAPLGWSAAPPPWIMPART